MFLVQVSDSDNEMMDEEDDGQAGGSNDGFDIEEFL